MSTPIQYFKLTNAIIINNHDNSVYIRFRPGRWDFCF